MRVHYHLEWSRRLPFLAYFDEWDIELPARVESVEIRYKRGVMERCFGDRLSLPMVEPRFGDIRA